MVWRQKWHRGLFLLLVTLWRVLPTALLAHGGGDIQVNNEPVGPALVSVWMNPPAALTNQPIHITVGLADPTTQAPVLDATVEVTVTAVEATAPVLTAAATTAQSTNKLFYETDFVLPDSGTYTAVVVVSNGQGSGEVAFDLVVRPSSNRWYGWLAVGALAAVALWAVWQGWRGRQTAVSPLPSSPRRPQRPA